MIAMPSASSRQMQRIVGLCEQSGVHFRILPRMQDLVTGQISIKDLREVKIDDLLGREAVKLRIINEPTAASLAYGLQQRTQGTIAVYDLGGGTFDISILKLKNGIFEVLATNGDTHLGGDDFDQLIADIFVADIRQQYGLDLKAYSDHMQGIRLEAERAKIRLSDELKSHGNP